MFVCSLDHAGKKKVGSLHPFCDLNGTVRIGDGFWEVSLSKGRASEADRCALCFAIL